MYTVCRRFLFQASFLLLWLLCSSRNNYAQQPREGQYSHSHIVTVSSLLPSTVCNRTSHKVPNKASVEVISKYGPCSTLNQGKPNTPSYSEILRKDRARINFIKSRRSESKNLGRHDDHLKQTQTISVPAKANQSKGSAGEFYATVSLGTPGQDVSLILDTGSGITWTQCKQCTVHCFKQIGPFFDPSRSLGTYSNIPCDSSACKQLGTIGEDRGCISNKCTYTVTYGDSTSTTGVWATDKLNLTNGFDKLVIHGYKFGCGFNNSAASGDDEALEGASGILGLDRGPFSFISQMPASLDKYFSYCLSSSSSLPGYITFGKTDDIRNKFLRFTTITIDSQVPEFYEIVITGISVGGKKLPVQSSAYMESFAVIDSGTTITSLPMKVYLALRSAFRKQMSQYKMTKPISGLDTCYDFSSYDSVVIPKISIFFKGGVELELDARGIIIFVNDISSTCLGFVGNTDETDPLIFGNLQQRGIEVHYDVARGKLGFGPGGCS